MSILSSYTFSIEYSHALLFENMVKNDALAFLKEIVSAKRIKESGSNSFSRSRISKSETGISDL